MQGICSQFAGECGEIRIMPGIRAGLPYCKLTLPLHLTNRKFFQWLKVTQVREMVRSSYFVATDSSIQGLFRQKFSADFTSPKLVVNDTIFPYC